MTQFTACKGLNNTTDTALMFHRPSTIAMPATVVKRFVGRPAIGVPCSLNQIVPVPFSLTHHAPKRQSPIDSKTPL